MDQPSIAALVSAFLERPGNARAALAAGSALCEAGQIELAVAVWTLGDDANPAIRRLKDNPQAPEQGRRLSALADATLCEFLAALHQRAVDAFEAQTSAAVPRVRNAVWTLTHPAQVAFREPLQRPLIFYMPDLPAAAVEPREAFGWVADLEAAVPAIRREYEANVRTGVAAEPYVPAGARAPEWQRLSGSLDWAAIHLYQDAAETPAAASFPETVRALGAVQLVRIDGTPMEVFFSRLKAGAHIPPHHGLTNTRVTVHLPLVVPPHCAIRVAQGVHEWHEGRAFAFDDSFEHEAWNRSDADRVVLIFEAHHPALTAHERDAVEHVYNVRQKWLDARHGLLQEWLNTGLVGRVSDAPN
jgi:aspartyl/asparaginyl beta-hydroxylase (cupin superfamily)